MWTLRDVPGKPALLSPQCLRWKLSCTTLVGGDGRRRDWWHWSSRGDLEPVPRRTRLGVCVDEDGALTFVGRYEQGTLRQGLHIAAERKLALLDQGRAATSYRKGVLELSSPWSEGQEVGRGIDYHQWVKRCISDIV